MKFNKISKLGSQNSARIDLIEVTALKKSQFTVSKGSKFLWGFGKWPLLSGCPLFREPLYRGLAVVLNKSNAVR